tara:strand:- start:174 stop:407 length:234 start_codon:yes stop_codon:yes gene_type:complete
MLKKIRERSILYWKKLITKKAIARVEKNLAYQQKKPQDYTKDEMRVLIEKEKREVINGLKTKAGVASILALLGIPNL